MDRLTKAQLMDRSRYKFEMQEVELPEVDGTVLVKTLSVGEREALPDLVDADGKPVPDPDQENIATVFSMVVSEPSLTAEEAQKFLADLPATALDKVIVTFSELLGSKEDSAAKKREFHSADNGS